MLRLTATVCATFCVHLEGHGAHARQQPRRQAHHHEAADGGAQDAAQVQEAGSRRYINITHVPTARVHEARATKSQMQGPETEGVQSAKAGVSIYNYNIYNLRRRETRAASEKQANRMAVPQKAVSTRPASIIAAAAISGPSEAPCENAAPASSAYLRHCTAPLLTQSRATTCFLHACVLIA